MNKTSKKKANKNGEMSLSGHLKELRNRIIVVLVVLIVGMVACFSYSDPIVGILTSIGTKCGYEFIQIRPQEVLMVYFSMSLLCGFLIALPLTAYEVFAFCSPGMKKKEKRFLGLALTFGLLFFVFGVYFAYKITLPFMLGFLIKFGGETIVSAISIQEYVSFVLLVFVIFGVIFELPVISVLLTGLGLIKPDWIIKARKPMIVVIFIIAAVITPPDIVSQIMVAIPIVGLYELSILLSKFVYRLKRKKSDSDDEDDDDEDEDE